MVLTDEPGGPKNSVFDAKVDEVLVELAPVLEERVLRGDILLRGIGRQCNGSHRGIIARRASRRLFWVMNA